MLLKPERWSSFLIWRAILLCRDLVLLHVKSYKWRCNHSLVQVFFFSGSCAVGVWVFVGLFVRFLLFSCLWDWTAVNVSRRVLSLFFGSTLHFADEKFSKCRYSRCGSEQLRRRMKLVRTNFIVEVSLGVHNKGPSKAESCWNSVFTLCSLLLSWKLMLTVVDQMEQISDLGVCGMSV